MTFSIWAKLCEFALRMFFTRPASLKILPIALGISSDNLIETWLRLVNVISCLQGDPSVWLQPPIDLVPTVLAADGPLLQLPTAQAG